MLNPFINLISNIISLVNLLLIVWIVLGLLVHFDIVNRFNPLVKRIQQSLDRFFNPLLDPIRRRLKRWLPDMGGLDITPIVFLFLLHFIEDALYSWFYQI